MFNRRLKVLMIVLAAPVAALIARFVQLQVVRAASYKTTAEKMLIQPVRFLPFVRGDITDRKGRLLAYDAPSWDICMYYGALAESQEYLKALARKRLSNNVTGEVETLRNKIEASWHAMSELTGKSMDELSQLRDTIVRRVQRIKEFVSRKCHIETPVLEERMVHPITQGLSREQQVSALVELAPYSDWVEVVAGHARCYAGGEAVGHVLGRLNRVLENTMEDDPNADDELARYQLSDLHGVCGVEALAERWLRGRRGSIQEDITGQYASPPIEPQNGKTFRLTIDLELQRALYEHLAATVDATPASTGGSAVVLDLPSRQVLALLSYPSFDPNTSLAERIDLAERDPIHHPQDFRAVASYYPPGSLVKPMILAAALADGTVTPETQITCQGHLLPDYPNKWQCTSAHGAVDPITSIKKSCNVFYYTVGQDMGVTRVRHWMSQFGLGQRSGTGLGEDKPGQLPYRSGHGAARNAGIGQGDIDATPIQVANMIATVATGAYRPATIWADDPGPRPAARLPVRDDHWRIVREGMFKVVNESGGTAFKYAGDTNLGEYVLLGKTGTAQASRRQVRLYACRFADGSTREIPADSRKDLLNRFPESSPPEIVAERSYLWPPQEQEEDPTHAWFAGYLTSRQHYLEPVTESSGFSVALAVVIEFGGKGGAVAGPVGRDMALSVLHWHEGSGLELTAVQGDR